MGCIVRREARRLTGRPGSARGRGQRAGHRLELQHGEHTSEADVLARHHHQLEDLPVVEVRAQRDDIAVVDVEVLHASRSAKRTAARSAGE